MPTSQSEKILSHLKIYGTISSYESYDKYGITQLAARIFEIEREGTPIYRKWASNNNKKFVLYSLKPFDLFS